MPESPFLDDMDPTAESSPAGPLERAWMAWRPGRPPPRWDEFLPADGRPCDADRVFFLVQVDIEFRARAGLPGLIEMRYFLHPRLDAAGARLGEAQQAELVRWEYQQRWKSGARPRRDEYLAAFPRLAPILADLSPRWNCPACRHLAISPEEGDTTWRCPRCAAAFAVTEIFPPRAEATPDRSPAGLDDRAYQLLDQLGAGGMGEVYRSADPALGRDLAVKVMRPALRGNAEAERRFRREARVTGLLQHPGIVPVHNLGRLPDGRLFFTMKLVGGRTLERLLAESRAGTELLGQFEKVCQAVAYAHSKGVIHRDLKPANVMVGAFGEVQVMDWGLAKVLGGRDDSGDGDTIDCDATPGGPAAATEGDGLSRAGRALGTPAYMPPEQAAGRIDEMDERADVFSLGAILCVMLTGRPPYLSAVWQDVLDQARRCDLADAAKRLDACGADAELVALCKACLAARDARPRDAGAVAARVVSYQAGVQERLRRAELERAEALVRERERRKRRRLAMALAAAMLLLAAGVVSAWWWRQQRQAATDQAVSQALAEARLLHQQALADPSEPARFREALAAARNAGDLARAGGAAASISGQADELIAQAEQDERAALSDRRLQSALLEVRAPREGPKYDQGADGRMTARVEPTADEQFAAAFREWGLDVDATPTAEAAARLRARPAGVVAEAAAALAEWAGERRRLSAPPARLRPLTDLADALESGRAELREILSRGRLPQERALAALSAALRPVPIPLPPALPDTARLRQLAARIDPATEPPLGLLTLAQALRLAGDDDRAEAILRQASLARPREVVLYQALGRMLAEQRPPRWREAAEYYTAARALRPELGATLAAALVHGGRAAEGLALSARLVAERPDSPFAHYRRGELLLQRNSPKPAADAYRRAAALDPRDARPHLGLGNALDRLKDAKSAADAYRRAIEIDPNLALAHNNLGNVLSRGGDEASAMRHYNKAIEIDPKLGIARLNLANSLFKLERIDEAIPLYRLAIDLDPTLFRAYYNLARGMHRRGERDAAIRLYQLVMDMAPWFPGPYYWMGEALRENGDFDAAVRCHQKVVEQHPTNPATHYFLGGSLRAKGDRDGAIRSFRRSVELDATFDLAHGSLGQALLEAGQFSEARESLRRCLELQPANDPQRGVTAKLLRQCEEKLDAKK